MSAGPGCLKSQTGQISRKNYFYGTILHFLAPFEVLTPSSILNFEKARRVYSLRGGALWAPMRILRKSFQTYEEFAHPSYPAKLKMGMKPS